jgi:hypothetical protein
MPPKSGCCMRIVCNAGRSAASAGMKTFSLLSFVLFTACATEPAVDDESPIDTQSVPNPDGKSDDVRACGESACAPSQCGYDCTEAGQQCTQTCAPTAGRDKAFVRATIGNITVDSRDTTYAPVWDLDNVLIYGCDHWDFSSQTKDGLEIELQQLRHSSFVLNPNDPTRHDHKLVVYVAPFTGPGSYRADGMYAANERSTRYFDGDACEVDVAASDDGGVHGTFACRLPAAGGASGSIDLSGEFNCPIDAMDPIFSRWTPSL